MKKDAADARKAKKKAIPLRVERIAEKSGDKQVFFFAGMQIIVKGQDILRGMRAFPHKGKAAVREQVMGTGVAVLDMDEDAFLSHFQKDFPERCLQSFFAEALPQSASSPIAMTISTEFSAP